MFSKAWDNKKGVKVRDLKPKSKKAPQALQTPRIPREDPTFSRKEDNK